MSTTLDRAFGRQPDPRPRFDLPQRYHARLPLLVPTERSDTLIFLARRLLPGLAGWLAGRHGAWDRFRFQPGARRALSRNPAGDRLPPP